jgi:hypothetical protein
MNPLNTSAMNASAVQWLKQNMHFKFDCEGTAFLEALPCIVRERVKNERSDSWQYRWVFPSTGCENVDFSLGHELGIAYLVLLQTNPCTSLDPAPTNLADIAEAMRLGHAGVDYELGFLGAVDAFVDCALNDAPLFAQVKERIKSLDALRLMARCLCVLHGEYPPELFGGEDNWMNGMKRTVRSYRAGKYDADYGVRS